MNKLFFALLLFFAGCHHDNRDSVEIVHADWPIDLAMVNIAKVVLEEELGVKVNLLVTSPAAAWSAIASGTSDVLLSGWLPSTAQEYYAQTKDKVVLVRPNYEGVQIGFAVPDYVPVYSIEKLLPHADAFDHEIQGIELGSGLMINAEEAMDAYNLSPAFTLIDSNDAVMMYNVQRAIEEKKWVVFTAWSPHFIFARWKLRFLEDPKNIFGSGEKIHTLTRLGLSEDLPTVTRFLQNFYIEVDELNTLLELNRAPGADPYQTAREWVRNHPKRVQTWLK